MACNNGKTFLNSLTPYPGATSTAAPYLIDLTHYTCGGRRICSLESFPVTADLKYAVQGIDDLGDNFYVAKILATGTVSYMPYNPGCPCSSCPVTEPIYAYLSVPVSAETGVTVTPASCLCSLNGVSCACNTSSSIDISAGFTVTTA